MNTKPLLGAALAAALPTLALAVAPATPKPSPRPPAGSTTTQSVATPPAATSLMVAQAAAVATPAARGRAADPSGAPAPSWGTAAAAAGFAPGPTLVGDGAGGLELAGDPSRRLLLLVGELVRGDELDHRRVAPRRVVELALPASGSLQLHGLETGRRTSLQAYQPPGTGQPLLGGYSIPITLQPAGAGPSPLSSQGSLAAPGDLVVTEFMKDPTAVSDGHGEWIELRVNQAWRLDVEGVTIADLSGASFTLQNGGQGMLLAPGRRYVLGNDADPGTNGGVAVDYEWSGFSLKNSDDEILVYDTLGRLLDVVDYDDGVRWPDTPGNSISLSDPIVSSTANDDPALWCHGSSVLGAGPDTGTPGAVNDVCP